MEIVSKSSKLCYRCLREHPIVQYIRDEAVEDLRRVVTIFITSKLQYLYDSNRHTWKSCSCGADVDDLQSTRFLVSPASSWVQVSWHFFQFRIAGSPPFFNLIFFSSQYTHARVRLHARTYGYMLHIGMWYTWWWHMEGSTGSLLPPLMSERSLNEYPNYGAHSTCTCTCISTQTGKPDEGLHPIVVQKSHAYIYQNMC